MENTSDGKHMQDIWSEIFSLGIDRYTILLILFLPFVSTTVGIARHLIGFKTLSIYAPIVLTYAFIELGFDRTIDSIRYFDGLKYGIVLFFIVFFAASLIYKLTRNVRMTFFPKMSLVFTGVSLAMLLSIVLAAYLGRNGFSNINIFSVVLISATSERLVSLYAKTNFKSMLFVSFETILLTVFNYTLISWQDFQAFLLESPWIIILLIIINLYVGRFKGLRLREYWRFREILDKDYYDDRTDGIN